MLKLPELIKYNDHGDWATYLEVIYKIFRNDFIDNRAKYLGCDVVYFAQPLFQGKEFTFWHLITEGKVEDERSPDLSRCERIAWPKPIMENSGDDSIKIWENIRKDKKSKKKKRISICYGDWEYLIILGTRKNHYSFITAYPVSRSHTKQKLKNEYNDFVKKQTPPIRAASDTPSTHGG